MYTVKMSHWYQMSPKVFLDNTALSDQPKEKKQQYTKYNTWNFCPPPGVLRVPSKKKSCKYI